MTAHTSSAELPQCDLHSETTWQQLYLSLRPLIKRWVYSLHVPSWQGQELDIVEDILQESIVRIFKYVKKAECGEVPPIDSLERISIVIAHNYCKDLRRKDLRLTRISPDEHLSARHVVMSSQPDASEIAIDNLYREWLYIKLSQDIVKFPEKQRKALLVDIANLIHFDKQPTPLQRAFLSVGIHLEDYRQSAARNAAEQNRYACLLSTAYKRLSKLSFR